MVATNASAKMFTVGFVHDIVLAHMADKLVLNDRKLGWATRLGRTTAETTAIEKNQ